LLVGGGGGEAHRSLGRGATLQPCRIAALRLGAGTVDLGAPWLPRGAREAIVARRGARLKVLCSRAYNEPLRRQPLQQRLRLLQITRVEPLSKPPVNRS
jgi:hypothetical protein